MPEFDATTVYLPTPSLSAQFYRVGSDGSLWCCQKRGFGLGRRGKWRQVRGRPIGGGYYAVGVRREGKSRNYYIHRLVLEAFVGPCPDGMEACHDDGIRTNNRLENLYWDTPCRNAQDKFRHGTQPQGSRVPVSKLVEEDIPVIHARLAAGENARSVATTYGLDDQTVRDIAKLRTWRHVSRPAVPMRRRGLVTAFGETKRMIEWAKDVRCVVTRNRLTQRLWLGWDAEVALTTPPLRGAQQRPRPR